jgi:hypothetical protein
VAPQPTAPIAIIASSVIEIIQMNSHTVPQKLLKQFAYEDLHTKSLRLYCYQKGIPPYPVSPKRAAAFEGYFSDPDNPAKENEIETRLNNEFENPVHCFLSQLSNTSFVLSDMHRRQMTRYLTLLFWRSEALRNARKHFQQVTLEAIRQFRANEVQFLTVTAKWNIDRLFAGHPQHFMETRQHVIRTLNRLAQSSQTERNRQKSYVKSIERWMNEFDNVMYEGQWELLRTSADDPFIISDSPIVTWERKDDGALSYGIGVHEPNVEVLLPVSPLTCLHILPNVTRNRQIKEPTVREVNIAQAAFAHKRCYANIKSSQIDEIVQRNFGEAEIGVKAFTLWRINYSNAVYELLMKPINESTLLPDRPSNRRI